MFIKNGKNFKTFYTGLTEEQIRKGNLITLILSVVTVLGYVALMLIGQPAKEMLSEQYSWFLSVNLLFMVVPTAVAVYCLIRHFFGYKLRSEITSAELPKGLIGDKKTFSGLEIQVFVAGLAFICEIVLNVYHVDVWSVICALIALISCASAVAVRMITYRAFSNLSETASKNDDKKNEEIEEFYD